MLAMNNNKNLFEILREKRNQIAKENNIKPFVVLHNSVLREVAEIKPSSLEELGRIKGMRGKKLSKYGGFILETLNEFSTNSTPVTSEDRIFSVSEFIDFLNNIISPQRAIVQGEIGQTKFMNGYIFFSLIDKNKEGVLNCFIWRNILDNFGVELKEGLELKVEGFPNIYKRSGRFNFEVGRISLVGEGALRQAYEALKKRLSAAGFFAKERKKPLPKYVERIGLITSSFGDAKNDFLTHLGKFGFKVYFYDVRVEGLYAVDEITSAIRWFNENIFDVEVLVLTRGGGSLESLQTFNSETTAKAIFSSRIPIITGIGHENNETISDLVADIYASTPTDAARILSDHWRHAEDLLSFFETNIVSILKGRYVNMKERLVTFEGNFISIINRGINSKRKEISSLQTRLILSFQRIFDKVKSVERNFLNNWERIRTQILTIGQAVDNQKGILFQETNRWLHSLKTGLLNIEQRLTLSDPIARLKQGYSIALNIGHQVIKSSKQIKVGEELSLKFYEGSAKTRVEERRG